MRPERVAIGFKVRTGRATAVVVGGSRRAPRVLERRALDLTDPAVPGSGQPYHLGLQRSGAAAERAVGRASRAACSASIRAVRDLVKQVERGGRRIARAGLVVGSDSDPDGIASPHVRAHAAEGKLFREAVEQGAAECGVASRTVIERELYGRAARALGRSEEELRRAVVELGRAVGRPWRAEEKAAALAGWMALR